MRRNHLRVIGALVLSAALAAPLAPAAAKEAPAPEAQVTVSSFSGAYLAGRIAESDNDLANAVAFYRRALAFDPSDAALKQSLLVALIATGAFDEALPYADALKTVAEVERFSRVALAIDSFRKGDFDKAEYWLKLVTNSDLDRLVTGLMTGWAKLGGGDAAGALRQVSDLKGPPWFDIFVGFHHALIAEQSGDKEAATAAYEALMANPAAAASAPETFLRVAQAYATFLLNGGDRQKALSVLDSADELFGGRIQILALRQAIEAGKTPAPLVSTPAEGASEVLLDLGSALNRGGGETFVRLYLRMALALRPDSDAALMQLAAVSEQMRNPQEAIELYKRIGTESPLHKVAQLQLGLNLADLGEEEQAIVRLKGALSEDPDDMRAYLALGGVYQAQKNFRAAADIYDTAVGRLGTPTRNDWNVFYQRGIAYERLKEWDKAEPNFLKALELFPSQPQVMNYLGYSWVDMNVKLDQGLDLIKKAVDLRPSDGYIVDSLGWAYYRLGRYDDALREMERAVSLMPGDPVLNDHLGDVYWRVGRKLEARFQWTHARDLNPDPDVLASVEKKLVEGLPADATLMAALADGSDGNGDKVATDAGTAEKTPEPAAPSADVMAGTTDAAPPAAGHLVRRGQSLWTIARDLLGSGDRYREILQLNPALRKNPDLIFPGQSLQLPSAR